MNMVPMNIWLVLWQCLEHHIFFCSSIIGFQSSQLTNSYYLIFSEAVFFSTTKRCFFTCHGFQFQFREKPLKLGPARLARHVNPIIRGMASATSRHRPWAMGSGKPSEPSRGTGAEREPKVIKTWWVNGFRMCFFFLCVCFLNGICGMDL